MNFSLAPLATSSLTTLAAPSASAAPSDSSSDAQHRKLVDAAHQFEGMLLQELLKPMREHSFGSGDTDTSDDGSDSSGFGDTLSSFGSESLASAISRSGGVGIAKQVIQQVDRERAYHAPTPI